MPAKNYKVLLVEDEPSLVNMYQVAFRKAPKINLLVALNKDEASKMLEKEKPDLVLLDIIIPPQEGGGVNYFERDGYLFLSKLRANPANKKTPVLVLTNLDSREDRDKAAQLGANEYLVKTENLPSQVVEKVMGYLKQAGLV